MSSTTVTENGIVASDTGFGIPPGDYRLIAWDLDLTGRRLLDEICQISAYMPGDEFSQYVMPYRKPNPAAQHRHSIRIVSIGRYRVMKSIKTGKVLRTKSEISALSDFIAWLEKSRAKDGVILLSYESRKVVPRILLEALRRYNLLDTFNATVKAFANGYSIAETKSTKSFNSYSLHTMSRHLLGKECEQPITSVERARVSYEVVKKVLASENQPESDVGGGDNIEGAVKELATAVCEHALTVAMEEKELSELKALLDRQSTFRPVFGPMVQKNRRERQRASVQRQLIAEAGLDYNTLAEAFKTNGKQGIAELMTAKLTQANSKITEELLALLVDHFDPPSILDVAISKEEPLVEQNGILKSEKETTLKDIKTEEDEGVSSSADTGTSSPINRHGSDSESFSTSSPSSPQSIVTAPNACSLPINLKSAIVGSAEH